MTSLPPRRLRWSACGCWAEQPQPCSGSLFKERHFSYFPVCWSQSGAPGPEASSRRRICGPSLLLHSLWHRTECDSLFLQSAGPNEIHLAVVSTLLNNLLREPVSRDWPLVCLELLARCSEAEDRQEMARETPEWVARLSAPLRSQAEETEKHSLETAVP